MGSNISRAARCDANKRVDSAVIINPPPVPQPPSSSSSTGQQQGGCSSSIPPSQQQQQFVPEPPPPPGPGDLTTTCNPGLYEELNKRCRDVFPVPFEGARLNITKTINSGLQVNHNVSMSAMCPSGYRFGSTYIGSRMLSPQDPSVLLMGEMDPNGNLNAQGIYCWSEKWKVKFATQVMDNKYASTQFSTDYRGKDWSVTLALLNMNVFKNTGVGILQVLQALSSRSCIGAEITYHQAPHIPGGAGTVMSVCGRYIGDLSIWSGFLGTGAMGLCYYRRLNEEIQIGMEIENNYMQGGGTNVSFGYQFEIPKANFGFRGMIDNNWTVTGVFEKRLQPMPILFSLCGSLNHIKNQFRLGCGVTIGG